MPIKSNFLSKLQKLIGDDTGPQDDVQRLEQIAWMLFLKVYDYRELGLEKTYEQRAQERLERVQAKNGANGAEDAAQEKDGKPQKDNKKGKPEWKPYVSIIPEPLRWRNWASNKSLTGDDLIRFVNDDLFATLKKLPAGELSQRMQGLAQNVFGILEQRMTDGDLLRKAIDLIDDVDLSNEEEITALCDAYEKLLQGLRTMDGESCTGSLNTAEGGLGWGYTPTALADFVANHIRPKRTESVTDLSAGACCLLTGIGRRIALIKLGKGKIIRNTNWHLYGAERNPFLYVLGVINIFLHRCGIPKIFLGNPLFRKDRPDDTFDVVLAKAPFEGSEAVEVLEHYPEQLRSGSVANLYLALVISRLKPGSRAVVIVPDEFLSGTDTATKIMKRTLLKRYHLQTVLRLPASIFAPYTSVPANILFFDAPAEGETMKDTKKTWFYRFDLPEGYKAFSVKKPLLAEHFDECHNWWFKRKKIEGADGQPHKAMSYTADDLLADYNFDLCGYPKPVKKTAKAKAAEE